MGWRWSGSNSPSGRDYEGFVSVVGPGSAPPLNALGYAPELLDLTRNAEIEETPEGRANVFIRFTQPQTIRFASIRYVAPDLQNPAIRDRDHDEARRYGMHFHRNGDAPKGTIVEGVIVRDAGIHALVPHASIGITFRDTIAFGTLNAAYMWDPASKQEPENGTNDTLYERTVAAMIRTTERRGPVFQMGEGSNTTVVSSGAVGVQAARWDNSGFSSPGTEQGVWGFRNNPAQNNDTYGVFVWQNTSKNNIIDGFAAYDNAEPGVSHGACLNAFTYRGLLLLENDQ